MQSSGGAFRANYGGRPVVMMFSDGSRALHSEPSFVTVGFGGIEIVVVGSRLGLGGKGLVEGLAWWYSWPVDFRGLVHSPSIFPLSVGHFSFGAALSISLW